LAACFENANTGAGSQGVTAFETALQMYPNLADNKLGSTGHNQGGQAAFTALQLAEEKWGTTMTYAGLSMEPTSGFSTQPTGGTWQEVYAKIKSPMFILSGSEDTLVSESWVQQAYNALPGTNETYWWSAIGAMNVPPPLTWAQQVSVPWFRWKLLGDKAACTAFKALPDGVTWQTKMSRNEKPCQ
jgi:dienelactone hydrolase